MGLFCLSRRGSLFKGGAYQKGQVEMRLKCGERRRQETRRGGGRRLGEKEAGDKRRRR